MRSRSPMSPVCYLEEPPRPTAQGNSLKWAAHESESCQPPRGQGFVGSGERCGVDQSCTKCFDYAACSVAETLAEYLRGKVMQVVAPVGPSMKASSFLGGWSEAVLP